MEENGESGNQYDNDDLSMSIKTEPEIVFEVDESVNWSSGHYILGDGEENDESNQEMNKRKKATTTEQFETLVALMEQNPDLAKGTPPASGNKAAVENSWELIVSKINALGPPIRKISEWRKVWTDLRGRVRRKVAAGKVHIRINGPGSTPNFELSQLEKTIYNTVNPKDYAEMYGSNMKTPSKRIEVPYIMENSSSLYEMNNFHFEEIPCTSSKQKTPPKPETSSSIENPKKRRLEARDEELSKLIKLSERQTEQMAKMTDALENLTAAIIAQTKLMSKNKNYTK